MRSVLLKRCFQRGKREIKHFRVYLPSSFRNLPRASTTVYNRTLRSWVWVSFLSLTSLVFTECLIHNLQCEIMWYSVSVRAGGLAVNKNSKQSYSESVMFHLIGDSVRWELTIKVRWGRLLSRRCFSRTPHLLCLWRQTDRPYLQWESCAVNWRKRRARTGRLQCKLQGAFGGLPALVAL